MIEIIIKYSSAFGNPIHKAKVNPEHDTLKIFKICQRAFRVPIESQILKYRRDGFNLRLVPGWPISFYEIANRRVLILESVAENIDLKLEAAGGLSQDKNRYLWMRTYRKEEMVDSVGGSSSDDSSVFAKKSFKASPVKFKTYDDVKNINKDLSKILRKGTMNFNEYVAKNQIDDNTLKNFGQSFDKSGWSMIHFAVNLGKISILKRLIAAGCSLNIVSKDGITPLMLCIRKNHFEIMKLICGTEGIDINQVTKLGTALHIAIESNKDLIVNYIISKGGNPHIKDQKKKSALSYIENEKKKEDVIQRYKESQTLKSAKKKPPIVKGQLYKTGLFFRNLKRRYLVINTNKRTLVRYGTKLDVPDKPKEIIPLKDIQIVRSVTKKGLFFQSGFFYFEVIYSSRILFATKSKIRTENWINYLNQAITFSKNYEKAMKQKLLDNKIAEMIEENPAEEVDLDTVQLQGEKKDPKEVAKNRKNRTFKYNIGLRSFEILKFIGRGAFGRCRLKLTGKVYAMKVINKELIYRRRQVKYALSEANILENANHPFILSLHFSFQTPNNLYMVIDYCPGGDLSLILAQMNTFTEDQARFYICELLLSIESLHKMGVLYRDLKPENILLDKQGHIKLADFGLSRENLHHGDVAKSFCGSPIYLSPEMVTQKGATQASDIYGLGLVLYEMLFGQPPYYTEEIPKLYSKIKKANLTFPYKIQPAAKDILVKLLKKDPKNRIGGKDKGKIKRHPFFKGIDWDDALSKKLEPPFVDEYDDREPNRRRLRINDKDYDKDNWNFMRVEGFEFVRESEIDGKIIPMSRTSLMSEQSEP